MDVVGMHQRIRLQLLTAEQAIEYSDEDARIVDIGGKEWCPVGHRQVYARAHNDVKPLAHLEPFLFSC
jgi:hypothetical protein